MPNSALASKRKVNANRSSRDAGELYEQYAATFECDQ